MDDNNSEEKTLARYKKLSEAEANSITNYANLRLRFHIAKEVEEKK